MYFTKMDFIGSFLFGLIIGAILMRKLIKHIARKNKNAFIKKLRELPSQIPKDDIILNAIDNDLDQLMHHHGEKIDIISYTPYVSCMVDGKSMMLPSSCLIKRPSKTTAASL